MILCPLTDLEYKLGTTRRTRGVMGNLSGLILLGMWNHALWNLPFSEASVALLLATIVSMYELRNNV